MFTKNFRLKNTFFLTLSTCAVLLLVNVYSYSSEEHPFVDSREWIDTNFDKRIVDLGEIVSGGPPKDGIPSLDNPKFITSVEADEWLGETEPVIVLNSRTTARAYPLQILIYHEIVNDRINDIPVAVTFCPLCNASIVYIRRVGKLVLDFGTTGRLRKSDLVMYDRQTQSWWQQFTGEGIVGDFTGQELEQIPSAIVSYATFKARYKHGMILSRDTGYSRPYGNNPYRGYDSINDQPFLLSESADPRLPPMMRVLGISLKNKHKIYPLDHQTSNIVINDSLEGHRIVVFIQEKMLSVLDKQKISESRHIPSAKAYIASVDGKSLDFEVSDGSVRDRQTGSRWNIFGEAIDGNLSGKRLKSIDSGVHFAFAWLAFRPETEIYSAGK